MSGNPYEPPKSDVSGGDMQIGRGDMLSLAEFVAFIGNEKYGERLHRYYRRESRSPGFNVWAALFSSIWFAYRKLYFYAAIAIPIGMGLPPLAAAIAFSAGRSTEAAGIAALVSMFTLRIAYGLFANIALLWRAEGVIARIDAQNLDNETHLNRIAAAGGVSVPALLLAWAVITAIDMWFRG